MYRKYTASSTITWRSIFEPPVADTGEYLAVVYNKSQNTWAIGAVSWDRSKTRLKDLMSGWTMNGYSSDWRVVAWGMSSVPDSIIAKFPIPAVGDWDDWAEQ